MTTSPILNAAAAALYIAGIVGIIFSLGNFENDLEPNLLAPLLMISLLVLSVLVMAYCFFFRPVQMYLDGQKKEAANLFVHTLAAFALIVLALLGSVALSLH